MPVDHFLKAAKASQAPFRAKIQDLGSIRRLGRLLEHQQQLKDAGLARAVCTEKPSDWSHPHLVDLRPGFEVRDRQLGEHDKSLSEPAIGRATEQITGFKGVYTSLEETIDSFDRLAEGEGDDLPESAFMYVGTLDDAKEKAERLAAEV